MSDQIVPGFVVYPTDMDGHPYYNKPVLVTLDEGRAKDMAKNAYVSYEKTSLLQSAGEVFLLQIPTSFPLDVNLAEMAQKKKEIALSKLTEEGALGL